MKIYEDYFQTIRHITNEVPETVTWTRIESTGLAEVMEEAEKHGFDYRLECYDEPIDFNGETIMRHVRAMVFTPKGEE